MRRIIIDTDTGSDDAVALIIALKSDMTIEAITTVAGNVDLDQATLNALMTIEVTNKQIPPVYKGACKPLCRPLVTAGHVHGVDGMSDKNLIHPTLKEEDDYAIDKIIELVQTYPGEIEIITIGPVTNIALAMNQAPHVMTQVKHIYAMGTGGFGPGNITPVAEFNVFVDAEAFDIMLRFGVPITIIGFDVCDADTAFHKADYHMLRASNQPEARFIAEANTKGFEYNKDKYKKIISDVPDAVALGVVLWPEIVLEQYLCYCFTSIHQDPTYGQVVIDNGQHLDISHLYGVESENATVIKSLDAQLFKSKMMQLLSKK